MTTEVDTIVAAIKECDADIGDLEKQLREVRKVRTTLIKMLIDMRGAGRITIDEQEYCISKRGDTYFLKAYSPRGKSIKP